MTTTTAPATRLVLAVGRLEDVPRFEGRPVTVAGRRIAIFNTPSGVRALEDACPHKGRPPVGRAGGRLLRRVPAAQPPDRPRHGRDGRRRPASAPWWCRWSSAPAGSTSKFYSAPDRRHTGLSRLHRGAMRRPRIGRWEHRHRPHLRPCLACDSLGKKKRRQMRKSMMLGARIGITAHRRATEQARLVASMGGVPVMGRSIEADVPRRPATLAEEPGKVLAEPFERRCSSPASAPGCCSRPRARRISRICCATGCASPGSSPAGRSRGRSCARCASGCDWTADPASTLLVRDRLLPDACAGRPRVLVQAFAEPPDVLTRPAGGARRRVPRPQPLRHRMAAGPDARPAPRPRACRRRRWMPRRSRRREQGSSSWRSPRPPAWTWPTSSAAARWIAAVGPVTKAALEAEGLTVHITADPPKMGTMYRALAAALQAGRSGFAPPGPAAEAVRSPSR